MPCSYSMRHSPHNHTESITARRRPMFPGRGHGTTTASWGTAVSTQAIPGTVRASWGATAARPTTNNSENLAPDGRDQNRHRKKYQTILAAGSQPARSAASTQPCTSRATVKPSRERRHRGKGRQKRGVPLPHEAQPPQPYRVDNRTAAPNVSRSRPRHHHGQLGAQPPHGPWPCPRHTCP